MDQQEFADRTEAIKTRLYRTAYLYLAVRPTHLRRWTRRCTGRCGG